MRSRIRPRQAQPHKPCIQRDGRTAGLASHPLCARFPGSREALVGNGYAQPFEPGRARTSAPNRARSSLCRRAGQHDVPSHMSLRRSAGRAHTVPVSSREAVLPRQGSRPERGAGCSTLEEHQDLRLARLACANLAIPHAPRCAIMSLALRSAADASQQ